MAYIPNRGDVVWIAFHPQAGHAQASCCPAVVLSPKSYNGTAGLALLGPVTSQVKGYPFEVSIPEGLPVSGVVLSDQVKSLDWNARNAEKACSLPVEVTKSVLLGVRALIE